MFLVQLDLPATMLVVLDTQHDLTSTLNVDLPMPRLYLRVLSAATERRPLYPPPPRFLLHLSPTIDRTIEPKARAGELTSGPVTAQSIPLKEFNHDQAIVVPLNKFNLCCGGCVKY